MTNTTATAPPASTTIKLADLDQFKVRALIAASAPVAKWNRNKHHAKPLRVVTDEINIYNMAGGPFSRPLSPRTKLFGQYNRRGACIWLAPRPVLADKIQTLAHELAHHYTTASHDSSWRRMYAMMLALSAQIFAGQAHADLNGQIIACVRRYVRPERDMSRRYDRSRPPLTSAQIVKAQQAAKSQMREAIDKYRLRFPAPVTA